MRRLLWIAALAAPSFAACNYTVGECYPRGQGDGSAGVGGGDVVLIPSGAGGGLGAEPPGPGGATGANACNASEESPPADDDPYEASLKVFCSKPDHGSVCSGRCFAKGVGCVPLAVHPYKPEGGIGKLYACNDLYIGFMCGYHYPNGDDCHYPFGMPFPKTCTYSGND